MPGTTTESLPGPLAAARNSGRFAFNAAAARKAAGLLLAVGAGAAALHFGGWWAVAMAAVTVLLIGFGATHMGEQGRAAARGAVRSAQEENLSQQIVPVWQRHVDAARQFSERSMQELLESFGNVSTHLDKALGSDASGAVVELGAAEQLLDRHRPEIEKLLGTTRLAVGLKDDMASVIGALAHTLNDMVVLTKQVQTIGRATHLLALNASVEATRAGTGGGGFAVVAHEIRQLAGQSRQAGAQIGKHVLAMQEQINAVRQRVRKPDLDDDEIVRQAEANARSVIAALLGSVADISRSSRTLREASVQVQGSLEKIYMSLQSQDRLSQMMGSITEDMARLTAWLHGTDDPAAHSPAQWLERLESSYTMEEQRSTHHDIAAIDRTAAVEFF